MFDYRILLQTTLQCYVITGICTILSFSKKKEKKEKEKRNPKSANSGLKGFEYRIVDLYLFRFNLFEPWFHLKSEIRS